MGAGAGLGVVGFGALAVQHAPVSYTHLDVYKRQVFYSKTAPPAIWYYPRAVLLFLFDKENENGVSNGVLTKDAFFLITTVSYRSPRKKSITFEQDGVFMPIFPLFY